jgi:Ni,Fe-hydrogenase maturation factor
MKVLVFGNPLAAMDSAAVKIAARLDKSMPGIEFVRFDTAEDLEAECPRLLILDVVVGLSKPRLVTLHELELAAKPLSLHGFDLTWNLLLLKKLGRLKEATIIGVPSKMPMGQSLPAIERLIKKIQAQQTRD